MIPGFSPLVCLFICRDGFLLCFLGWPGIHCVALGGFELNAPPPKCWGYRCEPPWSPTTAFLKKPFVVRAFEENEVLGWVFPLSGHLFRCVVIVQAASPTAVPPQSCLPGDSCSAPVLRVDPDLSWGRGTLEPWFLGIPGVLEGSRSVIAYHKGYTD